MDPEKDALECARIAEMLTDRAETLLRSLHPHLKCKPGSQPPEESQIIREAVCSETRPTKSLIEDVLPGEEPLAKKPRKAPDTIPGLKHDKQDAGGRTIVNRGSSAWKGYSDGGCTEGRSGTRYTGDNSGGYGRDVREQSGYKIVRKLLNQAEEVFPNLNAEDILKYITTQLITKPGSQAPTGSEMNRGPVSSQRRPAEICREDHPPVKSSAHEPIKFEPFAAPGPSHSAASRSNSSKVESTIGNDKILNPRPEPPSREESILEPSDAIVQPPVVPPSNRPGRRTNQLQYLHYFIKLVWNNTDAEPFRQPADAKNMLEHYKIIRHPMDLGTIRKRLENKYYWCADECLQDIKVMFSNCFAYYQYGDAAFSAGSRFKRTFIDGLRDLPMDEVNLDSSSLGDGDLADQYVDPFPRLIDLKLDDFKQAVKIWFANDKRYHGFQHNGRVKLYMGKIASYMPIKIAEETLAGPQFRRSLPPRPKTAILDSPVLPARLYRSERISIPWPKPPPREDTIVEPIDVIVQPPVVPPPNRPRRVTNQLQFIQDNVIDEVWNHPFGRLFRQPVDANNLPDYLKVIRHPMDLSTIKKRLENKYYWSAKECIQDFDVMFTNFHLYMKPWDPLVCQAQLVEKSFLRKKAQMPKEEEEVLVQQQQPPPSIQHACLQPIQSPSN